MIVYTHICSPQYIKIDNVFICTFLHVGCGINNAKASAPRNS